MIEKEDLQKEQMRSEKQKEKSTAAHKVLPLLLLTAYDMIRRKLYDRKYSKDTQALIKELEELRKLKASLK